MQVTITLNDWIIEEIIGKQKNRSARVEELLVKGHMYEKEKVAHRSGRQPVSVESGILSRYLPKSELRSFL